MSYNYYHTMQKRAGSAIWSPLDHSPLMVVDIPYSRTNGTIYTTSSKTTAASALSDPVGAITLRSPAATDLTQATSSRRYYLDQMSDGQWAVAGDNVDDGLFSSTIAFPAVGKVIGVRVEYHTLPVGSELDVLLQVGGSASSVRISLSGPSYTYPGLIFSGGNTGGGSSQMRYPGFMPTVGVPFTVIIAYNGVQTNLKMNYRLWVDGVEFPNASIVGAAAAGGVVSSTILNYQSASNLPAGAKMSKAFVLSGDLGLVASGNKALIDPMQAYLVAA